MYDHKWVSTFAERLNIALEKRNITPAELAKKLNISEATISNYRKGKYEPKQRRLDQISQILNVNIPWLMGADIPFSARINIEKKTEPHPLLQIFYNLNYAGQQKLMEYAQDLATLDKYKKCDTLSEQEIV